MIFPGSKAPNQNVVEKPESLKRSFEGREIRVGEFWRSYENPNDQSGYIILNFYKFQKVVVNEDVECYILRNSQGEFSLYPKTYGDKEIEEVIVNPEIQREYIQKPDETLVFVKSENDTNNTNENQDYVIYKNLVEGKLYCTSLSNFLSQTIDNEGNEVYKFSKIVEEDIEE